MRREIMLGFGLGTLCMLAIGLFNGGCSSASKSPSESADIGWSNMRRSEKGLPAAEPAAAPSPAQFYPLSARPVNERPVKKAKPPAGSTPKLYTNGDSKKGGAANTNLGASVIPRLGPGEELWVIERLPEDVAVRDDSAPGAGAMLAKLPAAEKEVPMPLTRTDVKASILGYIAAVDVTQQFHNPYDEKIEAVYVFPLPHNAAVSEFVMTIGERRIRGIIRERWEAEQIYRDARAAGHVASLLTQERPNIFTQKVANIEPGKAVEVDIRYFHTLAYADGSYEFVFPMVVGPRFNPPGTADGVGSVARGAHGASGQATEIQYLKPGERSGHDIAVSVDIDAGVGIEDIDCVNHAASAERPAPDQARVVLNPGDAIPNKDFVLRYKVAGKRVKSGFVAHRDARGGFFTLMLFPPDDLAAVGRSPVEFVFVLDCSGSMNGAPIAKAKAALTRALKRLEPDDTFQIVRFSDSASAMGPAPVPATPENVRRALAHVESLSSEGGTMMIEGIRAALNFPHDPKRLRVVSFMTDGYIGNEAEIFGEVHRLLGPSRLFSFGVGTSVNRYLLEGLSILGKGAVAYVALDDSGGREVDRFYERVRRPALTDVAIDWGGLEVSDVYPKRLPDLFVGRPIVVTGRFKPGGASASVRVTGRVAGEPREFAVRADPEDAAAHPGLSAVWARMKIAELSDFAGTPEAAAENASLVKALALEHGLMSAYTAFVAADSSRVTAGDHGTTVPIAVPVPDGVKYETTVQERR